MADGGGWVVGTALDDAPMVKGIQNIIASMGGLASAVTLAGAALTTMGLVKATEEAKKFELQVAELAKLVGEAQAEPMSESISRLGNELPVARDQLFNVAETAARLGIRGTQNVSRFTKVVAEIGIATDASADQASESMARLAKITQTPIDQVRNLASAMNEASNTMAVSFTDVMDASLRASAGLKTMGVETPNIIALSASAAELSASSRRAGTQLNRLASELQRPDVSNLANALELTEDQFRTLRRENPTKLILDLARAMRRGGEAANLIMGELGEASLKVLRRLVINLDEVQQKQGQLNTAFEEGTSIGQEYNRFAGTANAETVIMRNRIDDLQRVTGERLLPVWKDLLDVTNDLLGAFNELTQMPLETFLPEREVRAFRDAIQEQLESGLDDLSIRQRLERIFSDPHRRLPIFQIGDEVDKVSSVMESLARDMDRSVRPKFFALGEQILQTARRSDVMIHRLKALAEQIRETAEESDPFEELLQKIRERGDTSAEEVDGLSDSITRMQRKLDSEEIPRFTEIVLTLFEKIANGNVTISEANEVLQQLREQYGLTSGTANESVDAHEALAKARREERLQADDSLDSLRELVELRREEFREAIRTQEGVESSARSLAGAEAALVEAFRDRVTEAIENINESVERGREKMEEGVVQANRLMQLLSTVDFSIDPRSDAGQEQVEFIFETLQGVEGLEHALSLLPPGFREAVEGYIEFTEGSNEGADALERFRERAADLKLETVESRMRLMRRLTEDLASGFFDMFAALISGAEDAEKKLTDMLKSISQQLAKRALQGLIFEGLDAIGLADSMAGVEGKAKGGTVKPGELTLVGEEGPEFFVPDGAGIVAPRLRKVGGGGSKGDTVNINVSMSNEIRALDAREVDKVLEERMPKIAQGVSEQVSRSIHMQRNFGK